MIGFVANEKDVGFGAGGSGFTIPEILSEPILYDMAHLSVVAAAKILKNTGSGGATYDATMYGSNAVYMNGVDQSVDLPIIHDISTTDTKQTATLGTGWVDNGADSYTATDVTSALSALTSSTTNNVQITFTISNYSAGAVEGFSADGTYTIDVNDASLGATSFTGDVQIVSVYEITIPANSYMTYYDVASRSFNQYDNTGIPAATTYKMDKSFQLYFTHTKALTANELAQLNADPNLLFEVWFNNATFADGFSKADIVNFIPANTGNIGRMYLQDISVNESTNVVQNGAFDVDISGWTVSSGIGAWDSTNGGCLRIDVTGTSNPYFRQLSTTLKNDTYYIVSFDFRKNKSGIVYLVLVDNGTAQIISTINDTTEWVKISYVIYNTNYPTPYISLNNTIDSPSFYIDNISFTELSCYEIENYTTSVRDTYANVEFGATNFLLQQDASGRPTGVMQVGQIAGSDDGRYIEVPPSLTQYPIITCTSEISGGDDAALTITPC